MSLSTANNDVGGCCAGNGYCHQHRGGAPCIPINLANVGERGTIVRISGKEDVKKYLAGLGFTAGETVTAVSCAGGNMILEIKGSRIAVDKAMAGKIMICPES